MTREPVKLSRATRAQLGRLPAETPIAQLVRLQDAHTVGVCVPEDVPPGLLLPPGLAWAPSPATTAADLRDPDEEDADADTDAKPDAGASHAPADLPPLVALRLRTALPCPSSDPAAPARRVAQASIVAVAGAVLADDATLADVTEARTAGTPVRVDVYEPTDAGADARADEGDLPVAPAARPAESAKADLRVCVDVLAYCAPDATRRDVLDALAGGVRAQVDAAAELAPARAAVGHFAVLGDGLCATFVWALQKGGDDSASAVARRKAVHGALCLPQDRPLFRAGCRAFGAAADTHGDKDGDGRLIDVHVGVKGPGLGGAVSEHLVDGSYAYCHYRQDKFDDSGWGCAYRSLQTIASWAGRQGYASTGIPSHAAIQAALVAVGDKAASFAGSREWIGANEVCYALEHLTGLQSRIVHVASGSDMGSRGRELARHFDEHGSPVMVGGGVLAWTILGVARDERTGKIMFLILDPHYEGRDERGAVQSKGWVAWKDESIFRADSFYNLCMPLRPSGV